MSEKFQVFGKTLHASFLYLGGTVERSWQLQLLKPLNASAHYMPKARAGANFLFIVS